MENISVLNIKGEKVRELTLNAELWGIVPNDAVLYDAITLARNSMRQGTHETKTRAEVSGGGRKPWKQKGTGRARQGSIRSPQWNKGGIVFGPHMRSYDKKQNRKERRLALKSALAYKVIYKELIVLDALSFESNKTKEAKLILSNLKVNKNILIIVDVLDENIILATRNLKNVTLLQVNEINTLDIIAASNMIVTEAAIKAIEGVLV